MDSRGRETVKNYPSTLYAPVLDPDVRHALNGTPHVGTRAHRAVQQLVEILVVGVNHVPAHVKQEALGCRLGARQTAGIREAINEQPVATLVL